MIFAIEIFITFCIIIITLFVQHVRRRRSHPPGPLGWPILGMLPFQLMKHLFMNSRNEIANIGKYRRYKDKYGPIWSAEFGQQRIITLTSWDIIKEAFNDNSDLFSGRPHNTVYHFIKCGKGVLFADGEKWRDNRHMALQSLRSVGMGKKTLEVIICNEADDAMVYLEKSCPGPVNIVNAITKGITNVMSRIAFEETYSYDDPELQSYVDNVRVLSLSDMAIEKAILAPTLFNTKFMTWLFPDVGRLLYTIQYCFQIIRDKCHEKMVCFEDTQSPNCVVEFLLRFRLNETSKLSKSEQNEEIIHTIFDLFNAGVDTTSTLLTFCCLMLGKYAELQSSIRKEIKDTIGYSGNITLESRKHCPKTLSFIDEVHRFCCIIPKLHNRVMRNCEFHGYKLRPDDIIITDLKSLFFDQSLFENPLQFDASRFLDETKMKYSPSKYLIPFGMGKRACLGESIAMAESFIFLVSIVLRFKITLPEETLQNFERIIRGRSGLSHAPLQHMVNIEKTY